MASHRAGDATLPWHRMANIANVLDGITAWKFVPHYWSSVKMLLNYYSDCLVTWWRHQMEIFFALLAICARNSLVSGEFPAQRPVTRSFDVFFDLRLNKRLSKQSRCRWFETPSRSLWSHRNDMLHITHWRLVIIITASWPVTTYSRRYVQHGIHHKVICRHFCQ